MTFDQAGTLQRSALPGGFLNPGLIPKFMNQWRGNRPHSLPALLPRVLSSSRCHERGHVLPQQVIVFLRLAILVKPGDGKAGFDLSADLVIQCVSKLEGGTVLPALRKVFGRQ